ncbi:phage tail assembly protein T [Larkinella harenae]
MTEYAVWCAYRDKYGPMHDVRKFDRPAALIAMILNRVHGGKATMKDYMPWGQEEKEATIEDLIAEFGGVNIGKQSG